MDNVLVVVVVGLLSEFVCVCVLFFVCLCILHY